jgi:hypothetical protein
MVWIWETYIQEHLNGGARSCRKCVTWVKTYEELKRRDELEPCEEFNNCKDPSCDYCSSCSHQHCKECHYNQQMATAIRSSETYQQVLRDYWEGTNWNPLPWAAEFYETYDFEKYYLGGSPRSLVSMATVSVLAFRAPLPVLNAA